MISIRTILHPTDFSENSGHAFRLACALARDYTARLILLHVQPPFVVADGADGPIPIPLTDNQDALWEQLNNLRPESYGITAERNLQVGDAAEEIVRLAGKVNCDLIVMGTHGRSGLGRLLMGSVAEKVLRKAPCPVVTVKHPFPQAEVPTETAETRPVAVAGRP